MSQAEISRERRKQDTRERILDAAAHLYLERGLDGVSIDDVARAAERTKGAVYGHFADKQALLLAIWRAHYERKRALIGGALADAGDLPAMLADLGRAMTAVFALGPWPALAADVRRQPELAPLAAELAALEREERSAVTNLFLGFAERLGLAAPAEPDEVTATLFALAEGLTLRAEVDPEVAAARFMAVLRRLAELP